MKIAYVLPQYLPSTSGDARETHRMARYLIREGHDAEVYTTDAGSEDAIISTKGVILPRGEDVIEGVRVFRFGVQSRLPISTRSLKKLIDRRRFLRSSGEVDEYVGSMKVSRSPGFDIAERIRGFTRLPVSRGLQGALLRRTDVDLYHAVGVSVTSAMYACRASVRNGIPLVLKPAFHSADRLYYNSGNFRILRQADGIVANTTAEVDIFGRLGIDTGRVRVVGCGVRLEDYEEVDGDDGGALRSSWSLDKYEMNVLYLSRLQKEKGLFDVIDAAIRLSTSGRRVQLLIAGADYGSSSLQVRRISETHPCIRYLGRVPEGEKIHLLHACDVLAVPSIADSFGIVYIEAWACGKPVIGADIPSTRALVSPGEDGFCVEYGNSVAIAELLGFLADHPETRAAMGSRGYSKVKEKYTDDRVFEATCQLYDEVLRRKRE